MSEISPEISEPSQTKAKETGEPSEMDLESVRTTKPGTKRLFLTLSILFSFLLGFPFLWKSVEIYRSSLPFTEILELESNPSLLFPCRFQAVFLNFGSNLNPNHLQLSILNQITKLNSNPSQCGFCTNNLSLSVSVDSNSHCVQTNVADNIYRCGTVSVFDFDNNGKHKNDEDVDEFLNSVLKVKNVYSVVVVNGDRVRAVVGKYRHGWIVGRVDKGETEVVSKVAEMFVKVFVNGGREEGLIHEEFMPVGADGRIVLSFNLLNAEPNDWVYDWDFQRIDETLLTPIAEVLGPIADISVESQVLYHTPKLSFSYWDEKKKSYIFSTKDLPFFVNSNEWHLDTSIAAGGRSKILQFVVYIPSAKECPLHLQLPNGDISRTNGFISPMWGGVIVWNPRSCLKDSESKHTTRHTMSAEDLQEVFEVFMGQFRQLFGLKSDNLFVSTSDKFHLLPSERGFTEWELDVLSRQHSCFNLHSCATTLGSLSRLVQSLPRMIIMDEIGKQVKFSLEAAKLAQNNASLGVYEASAVSSRKARSLAEDAFFHPSIMSVSYYSFEHCFAVYSPFFLPVSMHILLAALREWKRYKQEKAKYSAWKAKEKTQS
ncbi:GPI transamidase component PIG-S [Mangifera indica]|uniref:GPI transamidase component PIG-S n=1 Tax=Mangifera indica TaxID=29780 RepID=UPI001CF98576|nr:GPI transamidase component PIG-S [Mangifera indica]